MKLTSLKVLELSKQYNLIEGLSDRELNNPEGIELELRVGRVEKIVGDSFLGVDKEGEKNRYSPTTELVGDIEKDGNKRITLEPGEYLLVRTMEKINCPAEKIKYDENFPEGYIFPVIFPRTSLFRGETSLHCSTTNPNYNGQLTFGLKNEGSHNFHFELGARMFKIYWEPTIGEIGRTYSGQHQSGRMTSQGEVEVQN